MAKVKMIDLVEKMGLENVTPDIDLTNKYLCEPDVNRPALQLTGYYEHFDHERIQIIGRLEYTFLEKKDDESKREIIKQLMLKKIPCLIFCRGIQPESMYVEIATECDVPIFVSHKKTTEFMSESLRWLNTRMAPCVSLHGVLVEVYGVGVLITGESGIGKSESALELVKRGHRLISDDVVDIHKISDGVLVGSAPDITKHFIELRGIGIVDVKALFGVLSVRDDKQIDLIITLEEWSREKTYERLGLEEEYTEILGNKVVCHRLPIRPGRNLAIIVETAAINHRQKMMGYNAAQELYKRVQENLKKNR